MLAECLDIEGSVHKQQEQVLCLCNNLSIILIGYSEIIIM